MTWYNFHFTMSLSDQFSNMFTCTHILLIKITLFLAAYNYMVCRGYAPSYVRNVGICTWCSYNPLSKTASNLILDHILTKNMKVFGARVSTLLHESLHKISFYQNYVLYCLVLICVYGVLMHCGRKS